MSVEENLRLVRSTTQALNDHDVERFLNQHHESVIQRDPQNAEPIKGRNAIRGGLEPMLRAFPDMRLVEENAFGEGDWVAVRGYGVGTHKGPLETPGSPPIPPTNRPIRLPFAYIAKVDKGKIAEVNLYYDQAGMMAQLGLAPQGPPPKRP